MCMVTDNLGLVHHTIRKYYSWSTLEYDDLYQIGCVGLMKAANKYDETLGFQFATYAVKKIYGEIKRHIRDDNIIHFVRSDIDDMQKVRYAKTRCEDLDEVCNISELSQERVKEVLLMITPPLSIHSVAPNTNHATLEEMLEDDTDFTKSIEFSDEVNSLLGKLHVEEKQVIIYRYFYDMTQVQIAEKLQTNQVTVSRRLSRAIKKMKGAFTGVRTDAKSVVSIDECGVEIKYLSVNEASCKSGVARNTIISSCNGNKIRGKLKWRYS